MDESAKFKVNTYFLIIDQIKTELEKIKMAYDDITSKFNFFFHLTELTSTEVKVNAQFLQNVYKNDLAPSFPTECVHFQFHLKSLKKQKVYFPKTILEMSAYLRNQSLIEVYPYIDIALRMMLCTHASNYSSERSFSKLKSVKTYLRSTMSEDRLNSLAVLNIEAQLTKQLDYTRIDIIEDFARY